MIADSTLALVAKAPTTFPSWVLRELMAELVERRAAEPDFHEHRHRGQILRHTHAGGQRPHDYYDHPQDRAAPRNEERGTT